MKSFDGLNYYQILQIPVNSPFIEIKRAYKEALSIYGEDSLVTYSLFLNDERDNILNVIEKAFFTLIDENKRASYDKTLVDSGQVDSSVILKRNQNQPIPLFRTKNLTKDDLVERVKEKSKEKEFKKLSNEILSKDLISGNDLIKLRKALKIDISEIYVVTKISISVLKSIEENLFEDLPADVYLKNFLKSYAEILQIDPQRVVYGYLKNILHTQCNE